VRIDAYAQKPFDVEFSGKFEGCIELGQEIRVGQVGVGIGPGGIVAHVGFYLDSVDFWILRFQ
jgi:hypothetical protein